MVHSYQYFDLTKILSFDLELGRDEKLRHLGAVIGQQILNIKNNTTNSITQLDLLAQNADFILGHNILDFDLPWLSRQPQQLQYLLKKPIIDTPEFKSEVRHSPI